MKVDWQNSREVVPGVRVLAVRPGDNFLIAGLGDVSHTFSVLTHWLPDERRSVPHLGAECPWCPRTTIQKSYAPVAVLRYPTNGEKPIERVLQEVRKIGPNAWHVRIMEMPEGLQWLAALDLKGKYFFLYRKGKHKNAPLHAALQDWDNFPAPPIEPFDVRPFVERAWGLHLLRAELHRGAATMDATPPETTPDLFPEQT